MSGSRLFPERPFLAASVALVRDGRVLVAARGRPPLLGVFTLPGGLVETGETLAEAALRELREETGLEARILRPLPPVEAITPAPDGRTEAHYVIVPHAALWLAGEPRTSPEATAFEWVDGPGAERLRSTPELPFLVSEAIRHARLAREDGLR